jgi:3-dehydroquinate synthetase
MALNLGHTVGHALEAAAGFGALRHGEAVALGLVAAARVARALGDTSDAAVARLTRLLQALALPTDLDGRLDARALAFVISDKKRAGDRVRFVVPGEPGSHRTELLGLGELGRLLGAA